MANDQKPPVAAPLYAIGDIVEYADNHDRQQRGKVLRIEASWSGWRDPLIIYTLHHPTYRNNRTTTTAEHIRKKVV